MLVGSGVAAKRKDTRKYPNLFRLRKLPIKSKLDFCSCQTNLLKRWLVRFKINLPIVAPVAPTAAKVRISSVGSSNRKEDSTIQEGGISIGDVLIAIKRKKIPK